MSSKTYVIKVKNLETLQRDIAIVTSGNKEAAITKFVLHMHMYGASKEFNTYDGHFVYDEEHKCYYNKTKTLKLKIKHVNLHNDFILL